MKKQRGLSLVGLIIVSFFVILIVLLGFKLFTPYMQYFALQKTLKQIANDPEVKSGTVNDIKMAFIKHSMIDNFDAVGPEDLDIEKNGDDVTISAVYSVKVPLFYNISLLLDFNASSGS